uniref:Uncharacterized protein n=1 Tax=Arundo donax TaxID=35708 RepID=A0A0A9FME3_ARUDO
MAEQPCCEIEICKKRICHKSN